MKQKNTIFTILALIFALFALILSVLSFLRPAQTGTDVSALQALREENAQLQRRLDDLTLRLDALTMAEDENAYCNILLDDWQADEERLTLNSAFIQVQLSAGSTLTVEDARLVLSRNGEDVHTQPLTLLPGEGAHSFELALSDTALPLPVLEDDDQLELRLEVPLSNGQKLTASAAMWHKMGGELYAVVG